MQLTDLIIAKQRLNQKNLTLVIVKMGKVVFETNAHGVGGLLKAIEKLGKGMKGLSVADRIVGKAVALLCVYAGVVAVFAVTIDEKGIQTLRENNILYRFERKVPCILNSNQNDICPFEKLLTNISDSKKAYEKLKACILKRT